MWVSGIRPPKTEDTWYELALDVLADRFHERPSRSPTAEAETGLAIPPSCYWYIWRSDELYGQVVFVWSEGDVAFQDDDGAVSPFDSGGFWSGRVRSHRVFADDDEKRAFFSDTSIPLTGWRSRFLEYIRENYEESEGYVTGRAPSAGVAGIFTDSSNAAPAWTWEARLIKNKYRRQVQLQTIFWTERDRSRFEDFLVTSNLDDDVIVSVASVIEQCSSAGTLFSAWRAARRDLMRSLNVEARDL